MMEAIQSINLLNRLNLEVKRESQQNSLSLDLSEILYPAVSFSKRTNYVLLNKLSGNYGGVSPNCPELASTLMSSLLDKEFNSKKTLFIGIQGRSSGIGCALATNFKKAYFSTTTCRNFTNIKPVVSIKNTYSNITEKINIYIKDKETMKSFENIVIVDIDSSNYRNNLNIISQINSKYTGKKFTILNFLDIHNSKEIEEINADIIKWKKKTEIALDIKSLTKGSFEVINAGRFSSKSRTINLDEDETIKKNDFEIICKNINDKDYAVISDGKVVNLIKESGIMMSKVSDINEVNNHLKNFANELHSIIKEKEDSKVLILGEDDFMFIPTKLSKELNNLNINSEITSVSSQNLFTDEKYSIQNKIRYKDSDDNFKYIYNIDSTYKTVIVMFHYLPVSKERDLISSSLKKYGVEEVLFCYI